MSDSTSTVGLVVPPAHGRVPADGPALYPSRVKFVAAGLGLESMTPASYARALGRLEEAVDDLLAQGAEAVSLMGTSLAFHQGPAAHEALLERLRAVAGKRPVSTMAAAVLRALRHLGASRVAVGAAYTAAVTDRLVEFLRAHDIDVVAREELGVTRIDRLDGIDTSSIIELGDRLLTVARTPDAVLLSCGGLNTLDAIPAIERRWGVPAVSSSQAGFWDVVRLTRPNARSGHPSALFARER